MTIRRITFRFPEVEIEFDPAQYIAVESADELADALYDEVVDQISRAIPIGATYDELWREVEKVRGPIDDTPDEPTEALKALMRRKPVWEKNEDA